MDARKAKFAESQTVIDWLQAGKDKNACGAMGMLDYPSLEVWATGVDGVDCFTPIHTGVIIESLAFNPEADAQRRYLAALAGIVKATERAVIAGTSEIYFESSDERTDRAAKDLGFEEVKMFRRNLK